MRGRHVFERACAARLSAPSCVGTEEVMALLCPHRRSGPGIEFVFDGVRFAPIAERFDLGLG